MTTDCRQLLLRKKFTLGLEYFRNRRLVDFRVGIIRGLRQQAANNFSVLNGHSPAF